MGTRSTEPDPLPQDAPQLPEIVEDDPGPVADETREPTEEEQEEKDVVRYLGKFSERSVSREDFENSGVSDQEGAVWTKDSPTVPKDHFSPEALRVLSASGEFQVL